MKYYCLGIKGTGMSTLASFLYDLGNEVSGYDDDKHYKFTMEGLEERGIKVYYDDSFLPEEGTIITYSKALSEDHKEIVRLKNLGYEFRNYNELIGDLTREFDTISICGTHGKTTTTSLISKALEPINYFIGDGEASASKDNKLFVLESDEFNKHFLAYDPTTAVLLSIHMDHPECYNGSFDEYKKTFETFVNKAKFAILNGDNESIRSLDIKVPKVYFGFEENNDYVIRNTLYKEDGTSFDLYKGPDFIHHFDLNTFGKHMVYDFVAAFLVSDHYNESEEFDIKTKDFITPKRRFKTSTFGKTHIISDYAHHPKEIEMTIEAARQKYPNKKLIAVFMENTYSRIEILMDDYVNALSKADEVYILDIRSNRQKSTDYKYNAEDLRKRIPGSKKISINDPSELLNYEDAVILFMSCGDIYLLEDKLKEKLKEKYGK